MEIRGGPAPDFRNGRCVKAEGAVQLTINWHSRDGSSGQGAGIPTRAVSLMREPRGRVSFAGSNGDE